MEITIPPELASKIAAEVVARLGPALIGFHIPSHSGNETRGEQNRDLQRALPGDGYLRLKEVLAIIPVSKSTWYKGIADGRYPKPTKRFGPRIAAWDACDIRALLDDKAM